MAIKNRKKKSSETFSFPLPLAALLIAVISVVLLYVCLDSRVQILGAKIKQLEDQNSELKKRYAYELWKWEKMKSPGNLEKTLAKNNSKMIVPAEINIVRLTDPESLMAFTPEEMQVVNIDLQKKNIYR
jgi:hypothetical protein